MRITTILSILSLILFSGCIGDDIILDTVEESVNITNPIDSIGVGMTYQFNVRYLNNIGQAEDRPAIWTSSDEAILSIDESGLATGVAVGTVSITSTVEIDGKDPVNDVLMLSVTEEAVIIETNPERRGTLMTTSSYPFEGGFVLREVDGDLLLDLEDDFNTTSALPGLYIYLTNNPNTNNNAIEIAKITEFSGAQTFTVPPNVSINDYQYVLGFCKPFGVKVGDGEFE